MSAIDVTNLLKDINRDAIEEWVRQRARAVPMGRWTLCRVLGKYLMYVDHERDTSIAPHLAMDGYWESWVTMAIARHVTTGMRCIDVGANYGYYTVLLADLVGATGHVQAWEPQPPVFDILERNVDVNGCKNVRTYRLAAGPPGKRHAGLRFNGSNLGGTSVTYMDEPDGEAINVEVQTLDQANGTDPVDFVKLDAEGAEPFIWQGMAGLLARSPGLTVCMEFSPGLYPDAGTFLDQIQRDGFSVQTLDGAGRPQPADREKLLAAPDYEMLWLSRKAS